MTGSRLDHRSCQSERPRARGRRRAPGRADHEQLDLARHRRRHRAGRLRRVGRAARWRRRLGPTTGLRARRSASAVARVRIAAAVPAGRARLLSGHRDGTPARRANTRFPTGVGRALVARARRVVDRAGRIGPPWSERPVAARGGRRIRATGRRPGPRRRLQPRDDGEHVVGRRVVRSLEGAARLRPRRRRRGRTRCSCARAAAPAPRDARNGIRPGRTRLAEPTPHSPRPALRTEPSSLPATSSIAFLAVAMRTC